MPAESALVGLARRRAQLPPCPYCGRPHGESTFKCPKTDMVLPLRGRLLDSKFRLKERLGKGGMASVWLATNTRVDKEVAIKLIRPEVLRNDELVARFHSEAKAAGRIGHDNVCEILDFGIGPVGPYIVMEYLRGQNLAEVLAAAGPLCSGLAVRIVAEALLGLHAAHNSGIVHRDLKPENVFLHVPKDGRPQVKLMDFGVAKFTDGSGEIETAHGALLGTPEYMAPEQFRGANLAEPRTDIWAIGAILYRGLTGKHAFKGPTVAATLMMVTHDDAPDVRALAPKTPPALKAIIERCLAKDIAARFADVPELLSALRALGPPASLDQLTATLRSRPGPVAAAPTEAPQVEPAAHEAITEPSAEHAPAPPPAPLPDPPLLDAASSQNATLPVFARPAQNRRGWLPLVGVLLLAAILAGIGWLGLREPTAEHAPPRARQSGAAATPDAGPIADVRPIDSAEGSRSDIGIRSTADGHSERTNEPSADPTEVALEDSAAPPDGEDVVIVTAGDDIAAPGEATEVEEGEEGAAGRNSETAADDDEDPKAKAPVGLAKGLVVVGNYVASLERGPRSTQGDARRYCEALSLTRHRGLKGWKLPFPGLVKELHRAEGLGKGKFWTSARHNNRAKVYSLASGKMTSSNAKRKNAKALCVTRRPN